MTFLLSCCATTDVDEDVDSNDDKYDGVVHIHKKTPNNSLSIRWTR